MGKKRKRRRIENIDIKKESKKKFPIVYIAIILILFFITKISNKFIPAINSSTYYFLVIISLIYIFISLKGLLNIKKLLIVGILILTLIKIFTFYSPLEINGDNASYLIKGLSIAKDGVSRNLYDPSEKIDSDLYNIGTSVLFAAIYKITGYKLNLFIFKMMPVLMSLGIFLMLYYLFSLYLEKPISLVLSFVISLNKQILHFSSLLLTEIPFLFFILLTLILGSYKLKDNKKVRYSWLLWVITGLVLFFAAMVRNSGLLFILMFPLVFINIKERKFKKGLTILLVGVLCLGLWIYAKYHLKSRYSTEPAIKRITLVVKRDKNFVKYILKRIYQGRERYLNNSLVAWRVIGQKLIGEPDKVRKVNPLSVIAGIIILIGLIYELKKKKYFFASFFLSQFITITLMFSIKEYVVMSRYYFSVIPFAYYYFYIGGKFIFDYSSKKIASGITEKGTFVISILVISFLSVVNLRNLSKQMWITKTGQPPDVKIFINLALWIKENIKENAIIGSRKPRFFYVFSKKKGMLFYNNCAGKFTRSSPWSKELEDSTLKMYRDINVSYIVLNTFWVYDTYVKILPIIQHYPQVFEIYYFPAQFNMPEAYIKNISSLFSFVNNHYSRTKQVFVPTMLIKINKEKLNTVLKNI